MTFFISTLVLARDSHVKPDSEAGGLLWVEGWYQGPYGKFHIIIFLSHILHWPFPSIVFYIAKKIYEQTNCENKSLTKRVAFVQFANIFASNLVSYLINHISTETLTTRRIWKQTLEKTEGAIKYEQSRETGNIWYTWHRMKTHTKEKNTTQKTKKMSTRNPPNIGWWNQAPAKDQHVLPLVRHPRRYS
jgi:hypothetical protein